MQALVPILITLFAGTMLAIQPSTNAVLARTSGSVILAALISFTVGTVILAALWLAADRTSPASLRSVPAWAWFGGAYGVIYVAASAYAVPRLGLAVMLTIAIASQLAAALLIDHYGWLGLARTPVNPTRLLGVALVIGGVVLVRR